jgi:hypothetical protein
VLTREYIFFFCREKYIMADSQPPQNRPIDDLKKRIAENKASPQKKGVPAAIIAPNAAYGFLVGYMNQNGGVYSEWYAGISADPQERLRSGHGVGGGDQSKFCFVFTHQQARDIEAKLIELGCSGGPGGGDDTSCGIYIYKNIGKIRR